MTVVGPEGPLAAGIVDAFEADGLRIFGPSRAAAELEGSKVFCKELMRGADIPTAEYQIFRDPAEAVRYLSDRNNDRIVVKADGLAGGKGVVVCSAITTRQSQPVVEQIAMQKIFKRGRRPSSCWKSEKLDERGGERAGNHRWQHDRHPAASLVSARRPSRATMARTPAGWGAIALAPLVNST